tara:strand:+ start:1954 stop:2655 length:702 start_codon:yes stop_codon:yes gene_type:complete
MAKRMRKSTTKYVQEVCAVIDRSGSMAGKEADTVGGINSTFNVLRDSLDENTLIKISIKLFDHEQILKVRSLDLKEVRDMRVDEFKPRGQTALLDAMGDTLAYFMEKKLMNPDAYDNCVIYVATDGLENCSKRYTNDKIKKMIETAKNTYNIEILYLAANQDAILEANKYGINSDNAINYSENTENVREVYRSAASAAVRSRSGGGISFTQVERSRSQPQYVNNTNSIMGSYD